MQAGVTLSETNKYINPVYQLMQLKTIKMWRIN